MQYANRNPNWRPKLLSLLAMSLMFFILTETVVASSERATERMPVKEVSIFKDGHAFVLHEGRMPVDADGNVMMDYLPRPIIGTFWAYSADAKAKLTSVVSGKRVVPIKRTALTIPELIAGNIGARVLVRDQNVYEATILGIPTRSSQELGHTDPPGTPEALPVRSDVVLLKVAEGVKIVHINQIQQITFLGEPNADLAREEFLDTMTLKLDWGRNRTAEAANVGMVYVQRGIRWIPNYRVEIDGKGRATVKLQATIINELADIENVKAHLVIGVPRFAFEKTLDPISLQQTVAQLSQHFRSDSQSAYAFSNMIMTQAEAPVRRVDTPAGGDAIDLGPDVAGSGKNEDLYVFTLEHVTLKKGQRLVVPVAEYELEYEDVFVLDLPFGPPPEVEHRFNNEQHARLAQLYHLPKVMHKIRLANSAHCPLTTAPALILRQGRIIAQGMMTYTAVGASSDLELTAAVDITVEKLDNETNRVPDATKWDGYTYARSDLTGTIRLTNRRTETVTLEIRRSVLGHIDSASHEGSIEHLGRHEGGWMTANSLPFWWHWYNWPYWWYHFNSVGRVTWKHELQPGHTIELGYEWHYFWRR
ncbi:MAG: hypothetical protein JSW66_09285 [Phycisphaerales bacterium]|nr:MAG: hypothetical protein JSW66_09285 [Phycisphaerales bacterium]